MNLDPDNSSPATTALKKRRLQAWLAAIFSQFLYFFRYLSWPKKTFHAEKDLLKTRRSLDEPFKGFRKMRCSRSKKNEKWLLKGNAGARNKLCAKFNIFERE